MQVCAGRLEAQGQDDERELERAMTTSEQRLEPAAMEQMEPNLHCLTGDQLTIHTIDIVAGRLAGLEVRTF